jgi:hypothetical protein
MLQFPFLLLLFSQWWRAGSTSFTPDGQLPQLIKAQTDVENDKIRSSSFAIRLNESVVLVAVAKDDELKSEVDALEKARRLQREGNDSTEVKLATWVPLLKRLSEAKFAGSATRYPFFLSIVPVLTWQETLDELFV